MFQTASGVTVPFPTMIKEEFQVYESSILFNLSFEKLKSLIEEFINHLSEPLFFVLEIPLSQQEELELQKGDFHPLHKKICYLDGQSREQIKAIFHIYGDLLLNDGISQFAIYSQIARDGIYIQKYKVVSIYSDNPEKYFEFLASYRLARTNDLLTVWDTFSYESPGEVRKIEINGMDIFDVHDELVKIGLCVAEIVED